MEHPVSAVIVGDAARCEGTAESFSLYYPWIPTEVIGTTEMWSVEPDADRPFVLVIPAGFIFGGSGFVERMADALWLYADVTACRLDDLLMLRSEALQRYGSVENTLAQCRALMLPVDS